MKSTIEKSIDLKAPIEKVWEALTDHKKFGSWFLVELEKPFKLGEVTNGAMTNSECSDMKFSAITTRLESPSHFSYRWPTNEKVELSGDTPLNQTTLVEFELTQIENGTRLTVRESGFELLSENTRLNALRDNTRGWSFQADNIRNYVER